jgi:CBS domain-containing protein
MQVKEVMIRDVKVLQPGVTVQEAALFMRKLDLAMMPVCDGTRLLGMLADRDLVVRAAAEGLDPTRTRVRDVMPPETIFLYEDQSVEEAARVMAERQLRRIAVLDRDKHLCGIVSMEDLAELSDGADGRSEPLDGSFDRIAPVR